MILLSYKHFTIDIKERLVFLSENILMPKIRPKKDVVSGSEILFAL